MNDYITAIVGGIKLYIFGSEVNPGAPVVFVTHGRMGEASYVFDYCRDLAEVGLIAIALDQRNHGERLVDVKANEGWGINAAADMYSIIVGTAMDVSMLIDMIPARLDIPMDKVGMTGVSLGGHATLIAMCLDERIQVGVPIIGSGDYRRLMELRAREYGCPKEDFVKYFPPALEAAVRRYDPIHHGARFANRPLLMLNGSADNIVQPECNQRLRTILKAYYDDSSLLQLNIYPGVGHQVPAEMWNEALEWLKKWLLM